MKMYGIANCDTVKKARQWCAAHGVLVEFHDFKKHGIDANLISRWLRHEPWQSLLNRNGQTWRKLDEAARSAIQDEASALALMIERPSVIRRPLVELDNRLIVGFSADQYTSIFKVTHVH